MSSSLNVQLTDALRKYVDERASDKDVYATPSEYIRDLIRQDMQDRAIALNVLEGLDDLKHGRPTASRRKAQSRQCRRPLWARRPAFLGLSALNITRSNVIIVSLADEINLGNQDLRYIGRCSA